MGEVCEKAKAARSDRVREACKGVCKKTEKAKAATSDCMREACEGVYEEAAKSDQVLHPSHGATTGDHST